MTISFLHPILSQSILFSIHAATSTTNNLLRRYIAVFPSPISAVEEGVVFGLLVDPILGSVLPAQTQKMVRGGGKICKCFNVIDISRYRYRYR